MLSLFIALYVAIHEAQERAEMLEEAYLYIEEQERLTEAYVSGYAYEFTEQEEWELLAVAYLEGGNQGTEGIAMIMRVILNRVEDPRYPDNIHDVVYAPGQFTVIGALPYAKPNEDCYTALEMIKCGWDKSYGVEHFWGDGKMNHFY